MDQPIQEDETNDWFE